MWPCQTGDFFVASAYSLLAGFDQLQEAEKWRSLWKLDVPERIRLFIWQLLHGKFLTKQTKHRWGWEIRIVL